MAILFLSDAEPADRWAKALAARLPEDDIVAGWGNCDPGAVEFAVVWYPTPGVLAQCPNLRAILSLGAGVDHVFTDPELPADVPVVRLIDPALTEQMSEWVAMNVLRHHRAMPDYAIQQAQARWHRLDLPLAGGRRVGIMGLGVLGSDAAHKLAGFGFPLAAWVRSPRAWDLGDIFAGDDGLRPFLARSDIVVCLLPLTEATHGILDARAFAALPRGAAVINAARGGHVVAADLIAALDAGHLSGATLDVFLREPLPADDPLWRHPRITVTPHVAAITLPDTAAREMARTIERCRAGRPLAGLVDRGRGY